MPIGPTGVSGSTPRRLLIATAVAHYKRSPYADRPGLVRARQRIIDLFVEKLGYTHLSELGLDPDRASLLDHLDRFATDSDRRPDDIVVVYLAGHGQLVGPPPGQHMFFPSDADVARPKQALPTAQVASALLDDSDVAQLLIILDTCHSGQGAKEAVDAALQTLRRNAEESTRVAFLAAAQPAQLARVNALPELLATAVDSLATAGEKPATLDLGTLVAHMNANPDRPQDQIIEWHAARMSGEVPAFFPNPRMRTGAINVDMAIQQAAEWQAQAERRDTELVRRMLIRAMASFGEEGGWWFAGRRRTLTDVSAWLHQADDRHPAMIITGGPGSGKTAILGLVAVLTHPERRASVPLHTLDLPVRATPQLGTVDVAIYAQALTDDDVLRGLAAAARVMARTPGALLDALANRERPVTAIIDALDEAATPETLVTQLIRPLIRYSNGRLRLLLGCRPHLLRHLHADAVIVDLDNATYADREALGAYALRGLTESYVDSAYVHAPAATAVEVARAVADAAFPSFLVARIVSSTLAADPRIPPDPRDPVWLRSLPRTAESAMARDLDDRLGTDASRARDLLRPLAFAEGQGLPWEDIWAPLASRVADRTYTDDDLLWLRHATGRYVVEATEEGHSAYRLYHQALAEHLRVGVDEFTVHDVFVQVLLSRVPRTQEGHRDWPRAHPYVRRYLATHAARSSHLDDLLRDCEYLVFAEPDQLIPALTHAASGRSQSTARIYRTSSGDHRWADPMVRRQLLAIDAARHGDRDLSHALSAGLSWRPRWATNSQLLTTHRSAHTSAVISVACLVVDGSPIVVGGNDSGQVRVWDARTGMVRASLDGHTGAVNAAACAVVDGVPVALTGGDDYTVRMWNLLTGKQLAVFSGQAGSVGCIACTTVGDTPVAVVGGLDAALRLWDLRAGDQLMVLKGHAGAVNGVACHVVDGVPVAVSVGADGTVRVWDLRNGVQRAALTGHNSWVWSVSCTVVDGVPLAFTGGGGDGAVRVWDLRGLAPLAAFNAQTGWVNGVACAAVRGATAVIVGGGDHAARVWDYATDSQRLELRGHTGAINAVSTMVLDDVPLAVTAGADGLLRMWNLAAQVTDGVLGVAAVLADNRPPRGEPQPTAPEALKGHTGWAWAVDCTQVRGACVAVTVGGDGDGAIRVWEVTSGRQLASLTGYTGAVNAVACSVVDNVPVAVVAGGGDYAVRVWDLHTGQRRSELWGQSDWVWSIATATVGEESVVVVGGANGMIRVWDLRAGRQLASLVSHRGVVNGLACTVLDTVATAVSLGDDGLLRLWDLQAHRLMSAFEAQPGVGRAVACCLFDGAPTAATVGDDGLVRIWDLASARQVAGMAGHTGVVNAVACGMVDGAPVMVTAGDDCTIRVWDPVRRMEVAVWVTPYPARAVAVGSLGDIVAGIGHEILTLRPGTPASVG
ncbi:caspase family protein [Micromonospora sp. CPCC 205371]|nr:caspase family protein [Micromonospora sp. CPCC 205371]